MANNCKRGLNTSEETKPRVSKVASKPVEKEGRSSSSTSSPEKTEEQSAEAEKGDDTMKVLIDEANRMLRSLQETDPKEKVMVTKNAEDKMSQLQRQLDEIKKITLRPFRLSRVGCSSLSGLLDSGATHPLRPVRKNEKLDHYPKVQVTLAGDQQVTMSLAPTGVIIGGPGAEPIVPMGLLTKVLNCKISWDGEALQVLHPTMGSSGRGDQRRLSNGLSRPCAQIDRRNRVYGNGRHEGLQCQREPGDPMDPATGS